MALLMVITIQTSNSSAMTVDCSFLGYAYSSECRDSFASSLKYFSSPLAPLDSFLDTSYFKLEQMAHNFLNVWQ